MTCDSLALRIIIDSFSASASLGGFRNAKIRSNTSESSTPKGNTRRVSSMDPHTFTLSFQLALDELNHRNQSHHHLAQESVRSQNNTWNAILMDYPQSVHHAHNI